jgi:hypothetical protein
MDIEWMARQVLKQVVGCTTLPDFLINFYQEIFTYTMLFTDPK